MTAHIKRFPPLFIALAAFISLILCSPEALQSARSGLSLCANVIIPSLFPFFVLSSLLSMLGLPAYLGRLLERPMSSLFGVSGCGAAAFIFGITGGYPVGAATVAGLRQRGEISRDEGERLLAFCNNSGPSFIVGAAGVGVFGSAKIGLVLYAAHIAASVLVGIIFSGERKNAPWRREFSVVSFSSALSESVKTAVSSTVTICGFVVFFSVVYGILDASGLIPALAGRLASFTGLSLSASRAVLSGFLELGNGIGLLSGLAAGPVHLAVAAFILGWGGLSVHCQTLAVIAGTDMKSARHVAGRFIHGIISAAIMLVLGRFL